ncbi:COMM domain-containing protein 7-like [Crassostrea virginica]|uniref:COMM domain-containing protein 7-like n=1 Tax=Crassostrea virginica TaxID=6565 RepID=A0A8B8BH34_CRAVI|nr:COMM domain-containing protein 7-like [Crassostrea virginica]
MANNFHFSRATPPETMFSDFQALNKFPNKQFRQLVDFALEFLADPSKSFRLMDQLNGFAEENDVNAVGLKNIFKSLLSLSNGALKKSMTSSQIREDLLNFGLTEDKAEYLSVQWSNNLGALSRSALGQVLMVNQLVDMEWKFGVTAASSEVDKVGNTFLQVKLAINTGNGIKNTHMELTLPQFYSFLHEMEKAKASLEYLS